MVPETLHKTVGANSPDRRICLSVRLSVGLSVCLLVCLSACLSVFLAVCLSVGLPVCLLACQSVGMLVLSVCLSVGLFRVEVSVQSRPTQNLRSSSVVRCKFFL